MRPSPRSRSADYVVCSGLFDDTTESRRTIASCRDHAGARSVMICANPDIVVERGDALVYCAGAIADLYAAAGGEVIYAGKPYRPIYEQALAIAQAKRAEPVDQQRACWQSAIRCAPISRARPPSASTACS